MPKRNPNKPKSDTQAYQQDYYVENAGRIKARVRAYAEVNKGKISAYKKAYRAKNLDRLKAKSKAHYEAHRAEKIAYQKALHAAKPEDIKAYKKQWWAANRELNRAKKFTHYHKHREEISQTRKAVYANDPLPFKARTAKRRALTRGAEVEPVDLMVVLRNSKGVCGICKKPLDLFGIDFDHIVPLSKGGPHTLANLQATHARCNRMKGARQTSCQ